MTTRYLQMAIHNALKAISTIGPHSTIYLSLYIYVYILVFTNRTTREAYKPVTIFVRSLTGWKSGFSFS